MCKNKLYFEVVHFPQIMVYNKKSFYGQVLETRKLTVGNNRDNIITFSIEIKDNFLIQLTKHKL